MPEISKLKKDVKMVQQSLGLGVYQNLKEQQRLQEGLEMLARLEEYTNAVNRMTDEEKQREAERISEYYDHVILEPELEPYRQSLRNAAVHDLQIGKKTENR